MAIIVEIGKSHPFTLSSASWSVVLPIRAQLHIFLLSKAMKVVRNRCPFVFPSPNPILAAFTQSRSFALIPRTRNVLKLPRIANMISLRSILIPIEGSYGLLQTFSIPELMMLLSINTRGPVIERPSNSPSSVVGGRNGNGRVWVQYCLVFHHQLLISNWWRRYIILEIILGANPLPCPSRDALKCPRTYGTYTRVDDRPVPSSHQCLCYRWRVGEDREIFLLSDRYPLLPFLLIMST